ncbi:hypothetical protein [Polaribacter sp. 20A6]|uniref:hypothetical protein n=1 Tax=Polaribacter sp. 20A6 TaxID=2687289 RepID=UPI0013FE38CA|nr:hypothetical protein [Polaribacter sp. 20A6]
MFDFIGCILDTYLDIKHWFKTKKRRKYEKENNLPKSIVWHPMTKPLLIFFIIITPIIFLFSFFFFNNENKKRTTKRMLEISKLLEAEKKQFGKFPSALKDIIRNNPLRSNLTTDYWKSTFVYIPSKDGQNYQLTSLGGDGKLNTKDDIQYSSN